MSKAFLPVFLAFLNFLSVVPVVGQDIEARIELDFKTPVIRVDGRFLSKRQGRNLAFLRMVAGNGSLAARIHELRLTDNNGKPVTHKKLMDGEYLADADFQNWSYSVDLSPPKNRSASAHASWILDERGILMLADLLPLSDRETSAKINFRAPDVHSAEPRDPDGTFRIDRVEDAVFYIGSRWDYGNAPTETGPVTLIVSSGNWNFAAEEAHRSAVEIHRSYENILGPNAGGKPFIGISRFPHPVGFGEWEAETRGRNVTIISSDMPFKTQSLQRLHEQLRHELFHLWIPNGVNLTGSYDWFYEGFALYQSLKLAVGLNRIRFTDFLDTLSRAHTIDSAGARRLSLVQASANRFAGSNTQVYARGMLVAFLVDLAVLKNSKGKRSVQDILRGLYVKHRKPAAGTDGNTAVIELLRSNPGVTSIVENYVIGTEKMNWADDLAAAGILDSDPGPVTTLTVSERPSGGQKTVLDRLGYNNWRRLSRDPK